MSPFLRSLFSSTVLAAAAAILAAPALADIPCGPDAPTSAAYRKRERDHLSHTLADAYAAAGAHDPKWDGQAKAFLQAVVDDIVDPASESELSELRDMGKKVIRAGCDDPLVQCYHARTLLILRNPDDAEALLSKAAPAVLAGTCSIDRKADVATLWGAALQSQKKPAEAQHAFDKARDLWAQAAADHVDGPDDARLLYHEIADGAFERMPAAEQEKLAKSVADAPKADPWLAAALAGRASINAAWEARGSGPASSVPPAQDKAFLERLVLARQSLLKAYELRPNHPEAACDMITVLMGAGAGAAPPGETKRLWFDRAVKAEFDFERAYSQMITSAMPRWGGAPADLVAFGLECFKTRRFDTEVPSMLVSALVALNADLRDGFTPLDKPEIYDAAKTALTGCAEHAPDARTRLKHLSRYLAVAWRTKHWDDARKAAELAGRKLRPHFLTAFGATPEAAYEAAARTSPVAAQLQAADEHLKNGRFDDGIQACEQALAATPASDLATREFIKTSLRHAQWRKAFGGGDWVDITPRGDLIGWRDVYGKWAPSKTRVMGTTDADGLVLICTCDFGPRYELKTSIVTSAENKTQQLNGGLIFFHQLADDRDQYHCLSAYPMRDVASVRYRNFGESSPDVSVPVDEKASLRIQVWDGRVAAFVNDQPVYDGPMLHRYPLDAPPRFGIGGRSWWEGGRVYFEDVAVRRLDQQPAKGKN